MAEGAAPSAPVASAVPPSSVPSAPSAVESSPRLPGVLPDPEPSLPPPPSSEDAGDVRQPDVPAVEAKPRFKFAGEEFDSQEAAEQNFRSLRGQYKPLQSLAKQLGGLEKIPSTLSSAAESARAWKAEHDRVAAELASLRAGQPAPQPLDAQSQTPAEQTAVEADIDWGLYAEIKALATESGEPWKAEQWLIGEVRKQERERIESLMDERLLPFHEARARQQIVAKTDELFSTLADYQLSDGSVAFPELRDEEQAYEVGQLWAQMGLSPEMALTPQGAIAAIALYRMTHSPTSQGGAAAPNAAPPVPLAVPTQAAVAAGLDGGRPTPTAPAEAGGMSAEAARIKAALRQSHAGPGRDNLGFAP